MLTKRIIPCLDVRDGRVVKGKKFTNITDVDDPAKLGQFYSEQGADELVFYDITASFESRNISLAFVEAVAERINIPFCVGGGIRTILDIQTILRKGADKVSINSAAFHRPNLIKEASEKFGAQCIVVSMDVKKMDDGWYVYTEGGRNRQHMDALTWAKTAEVLGAGELVINSIDADGMKDGYDIELLKAITNIVDIPVIASGGAGTMDHFYDVAKEANVDGILAASVFHFGEITIPSLKEFLKQKGILMRIEGVL